MTKGGDNEKFAEENNALMVNGRAKPNEKATLSTFIYNKREGKFLGRTGKSWAQIIVFYIIFYFFLAAFWLACLAIFLKTIDSNKPRYYGKDTIIGDNPGVGYQPWLKDDPESTLIKFSANDDSSYAHYIEAMENYLAKYSNINDTRSCVDNEKNSELGGKACRFNLSQFERKCGKANDYGFRDGKPCIILSLNRLIGWQPEDYADNEVPLEVKSRYKPNSIAFFCNGTSDVDVEHIGNAEYLPEEGIDGRFYPYAVMHNYHQPIAMVRFTNLKPNRLVMVQCSAYAKNIEQDPESRSGMVTFELLKQQKEKL